MGLDGLESVTESPLEVNIEDNQVHQGQEDEEAQRGHAGRKDGCRQGWCSSRTPVGVCDKEENQGNTEEQQTPNSHTRPPHDPVLIEERQPMPHCLQVSHHFRHDTTGESSIMKADSSFAPQLMKPPNTRPLTL